LEVFQQCVEWQATTEKLRMMMLALGDARVMLAVLANHLAQARSLDLMPAKARKEFVLSTEALYAPLANRLGVWSIKSELEDICFKVSTAAHVLRIVITAVISCSARQNVACA
jgi:GTP diphosphokinase / guanosine-3',5'-bis(diphosphate) 3'-diphosphatase